MALFLGLRTFRNKAGLHCLEHIEEDSLKDLLEAFSPWTLGLIISVPMSSKYVIGVAEKSGDESTSLLSRS